MNQSYHGLGLSKKIILFHGIFYYFTLTMVFQDKVHERRDAAAEKNNMDALLEMRENKFFFRKTNFDECIDSFNSLSANPTKWSNTRKQFVGNSRRIF